LSRPTLSSQHWGPPLLALPGVGTEVAGQLLTTAGDNPERLRSEAAFAHLCGVARSQPAAAKPTVTEPTDTGSTAEVTAPPITPSTSSYSAGCATAPAHANYADRRTTEGLSTPDHPLPQAVRRPRDLQPARYSHRRRLAHDGPGDVNGGVT